MTTSTRKYLAATTAFAAVAFVAIVTSSTGCQSTGIGDPCIPEQEYYSNFMGFDEKEVNVESKSFQCQTRLCLVNHFRGRVSCPYGQDPNALEAFNGMPVSGFACGKGSQTQNTPCCTPGVAQAVLSDQDCQPQANGDCTPVASPGKSAVQANCTDRTADKAVYCSCRCANSDNKTDDGAVYCNCPSGFECDQLINPTGEGDPGLVGRYCVKKGTAFDLTSSCGESCDPSVSSGNTYCGKVNAAQ